MDIFAQLVAPAFAGIFVGVMSGLLGVGGGTIMVPIFRLAFGMSPIASTATSLFAIIPTSISGVATHVRGRTCIPKLGVALGIGGAIMSPVGVWLASISPDWAVILVAALVIGFSAYKMFRKALKAPQASSRKKAAAGRNATGDGAAASAAGNGAAPGAAASPAAAPAAVGSAASAAAVASPAAASPAAASAAAGANPGSAASAADPFQLGRREYLIGAAIGLIAGLASGYVGVGGGFIMVPMMLAFLSVPMTLASGTSLIAIMILAVPGVIEQAIFGNINYLAGIAVVVGTIPGAVIGARLIKVIPERQLRFLFGCFLLVAAVMLMLNEFGVLG